MKTKKSFFNSLAVLLYYITSTILGIVSRKMIITILGIEYQGINGLFSNILSMLSIAELGIGTAIVYHMYRPLEKGDTFTIKALMHFYKKCYFIIGIVILSIGLLLMPFLKYLINDYSLSHSLSFIYICFLLDSCCSYLFSYKRSILMADQRNYIAVFCDLLFQIGGKLGQLCILWLSHNFILYLISMIFTRLANNVLISCVSNKYYPYLKDTNIIPVSSDILSDITKKVKGSFFHKIATFIVLGTDNLLISKFLGLTVMGIYSNYHLLISTINSICSQILTATTASIGHLLVENNQRKNHEIFMELQILNAGFINCAAAGIYCGTSSFITIIFGESYILSEFTLLILSINFCVQGMRTVYSIFKEAAGILYEDRFIPLIESMINLIVSLILLHYLGLSGIFLGTIISSIILYSYTYPILVFRNVLGGKIRDYYKNIIWISIIFLLSLVTCKAICASIILENKIYQFLLNCTISVFVSFFIFVCMYAGWKKETKELIIKLKALFNKRH